MKPKCYVQFKFVVSQNLENEFNDKEDKQKQSSLRDGWTACSRQGGDPKSVAGEASLS